MNYSRFITDDTYYVGASDRRLSLFENVFPIPKGVSYNSYVITDEKTALLDLMDESVSKQGFENIAGVLNGRPLDYVIINHMEPDHCSKLDELILRYPQVKVVGNAKTLKMINQFYDLDMQDRFVSVNEGDTLELGRHTLTFVNAPMVHWPEVMVTYDKTDKVLFSADGFGKFGTLDTDEDWDCEARRYYFNIVGRYGMQVQALLKKAAALDIEIICPLHGPILKEDLGHYIGKYDIWSKYEPENKGITIAYASIHGNTAAAAEKFAEILKAQGEEKVSLFDLSRDDMAEAIEDAFRYDGLVLASATYDGGLFPCMEDFLAHLKSKTYRNRTVAIIENGSWGPMAAKHIRAALEGLKDMTVLEKAVTIKSAMKENNIAEMEEMAKELRAALGR